MHKLFFLHVPKTGGTSFHSVLQSIYGDTYYRINNRRNDDAFWGWNSKDAKGIKCVSGHVHWGAHKHVHDETRYVILLRNPIDRLLSLFAYSKSKRNHMLHKSATNLDFSSWSAQNEIACFDNDITRILSGNWEHGLVKPEKKVTLSDFELAVKNLLSCWVVGDTSNIRQFVAKISISENWKKTPNLPHMLMQSKRTSLADLPVSVKQKIGKRNAYDMALWSIYKRLRPLEPKRTVR